MCRTEDSGLLNNNNYYYYDYYYYYYYDSCYYYYYYYYRQVLASEEEVHISPGQAAQSSMVWLRAIQAYMRLLGDGILVHGPLLGWGLFKGDKFLQKIDTHENGNVEYVMPVRDGCDETTYPWSEHGKDAVKVTRKMMRDMGLWRSRDEGVEKRASLPTVDAHKNANLVKRAQALKTAGMPMQPKGFQFSLLDDSRLSAVSLSILSQEDGNLPHGIDQFFGPDRMDVWSLFMQEKGDFMWAFKRAGPQTMDVRKIMGESVLRGDKDSLSFVHEFHVYDVKPVPQKMNLLSAYAQDRRNVMQSSRAVLDSRSRNWR